MKIKLISFILLVFCAPLAAQAQDPGFTDRIFLCFESNPPTPAVQGSVTVPGYEGCVEAVSVAYGVENLATIGSTTGAGAGKAKLSNFTVKKLVDRSSPALFKAAVIGAHFEKVQVSFVRVPTKKGAITETMRLLLKVAFVTKKIDTAASQGTAVVEDVTLVYGALSFQVSDSGFCFDTVSNTDGGLCTE